MNPIFKIPGRLNSPAIVDPDISQKNMLRIMDGSNDNSKEVGS